MVLLGFELIYFIASGPLVQRLKITLPQSPSTIEKKFYLIYFSDDSDSDITYMGFNYICTTVNYLRVQLLQS